MMSSERMSARPSVMSWGWMSAMLSIGSLRLSRTAQVRPSRSPRVTSRMMPNSIAGAGEVGTTPADARGDGSGFPCSRIAPEIFQIGYPEREERRAAMDMIDTTLGRGRKGREALRDAEIDARFYELRSALGRGLREMRVKSGMTQAYLAQRLERSTAAVSFMESAKPGVSIELQIKALFLLGASLEDVARMLQAPERR